MNANNLGPPISLAIFAFGIWVGWRLSRLKVGEIDVRTAGFGRGTSKVLRVGSAAFFGALLGVLLRAISEQIDSRPLAFIAVWTVTVCIGVGWGAGIRGWRRIRGWDR